METWLEDIKTALGNLGGIAHFDELYAEIRRVRGSDLTRSWKTIVRGIILKHSTDSDGYRGPDLFYSVEGIGSGVWGLRSRLKLTPTASDLQEPKTPQRALMQTYRVPRDTNMARKLKALHKNACQIFGKALSLNNDENYSEAHHIQPLGNPHNGPDIAENIIVLCPNHHVLFDYGVVRLDAEKFRVVQGHKIGSQYVKYHNNEILVVEKPKMRSNNPSQRTRYKAARR